MKCPSCYREDGLRGYDGSPYIECEHCAWSGTVSDLLTDEELQEEDPS